MFVIQDGTVKIWDTVLSQCKLTLGGHLQSVTCVRWGGTNLLYTASQDRTIKVWWPDDVSGGQPIICIICVCRCVKICNYERYIFQSYYDLFYGTLYIIIH